MSDFVFEDALNRLKEIVNILQHEDLSVDRAIELYKEGCHIAKKLKTYISQAKQEIEVYSNGLFEQLDEENNDG